MPSYNPNLAGKVDPVVDRAIQFIRDSIGRHDAAIDKLNTSGLLTTKDAKQFGAPVIAAALLSSGSNPLNVQGLTGQLAQPQITYVPLVTSLPILASPLSQDGTLVSYTGILYRFDGSVNPGVWRVQETLGVVLLGTHAQRLSTYPAATYVAGTLFFETDTHTLFVDRLINGVLTWDPIFAATIEDVHQRRGTVGSITTAGTTITRLTGLPFQADMVGQMIALNIPVTGFVLYKIVSFTNSNTIDIDTNVGVIATTYRYTAYSSALYPKGTFFFEIDHKLLYLNSDSSGIVSTNGITVTQVSGDSFDPYWGLLSAGASIVINGVTYQVDHVSFPGTLVLTTSAGIQAGVGFTVPSGKWIYISGEYFDTLANLPKDLGLNDHGLLFFDATYWHLMRWDASFPGFGFAPGEPGAGYIVAGQPSYAGLYWQLCNGGAVTISNGDGTTSSVTTPDLTGDVFIKGASAQGTQQTATVPTWQAGAKTEDTTAVFAAGAKTEDESAHVHVVNTPSATGAIAAGATSYSPPGSFNSGPGSAHHHDITNGNAPQAAHHHDLTNTNAKLNAPSEANGGVPKRIALTWWIRQ